MLEGRSMALFEVPARSPPEQQAARRALSRVDKSRGPSPKTPPLTVNRGSRHGLGEPLGGAGSRPSGEPCPPRPAGGPTRCGLEPQAWAPGLPSPCLGPPARFGSGGLRAGRAGPWLICSVWGHLSQRWVTGSASWPQTGGNGQQPHGVLAAQQAGQLHQPEPGRRGARGGRGQPEAGSQGACPSPSPPPRASPPPTLPQDPGCGLLSPTLFLSPGAVTLLPLPGSCFLGGCLFLGVRPQLRPAAVRVLCRDLGAVLEEPPRCPGEAVG